MLRHREPIRARKPNLVNMPLHTLCTTPELPRTRSHYKAQRPIKISKDSMESSIEKKRGFLYTLFKCSTFANAKSRSRGYRGALHIYATMTNFYAEKINFWVEQTDNRRATKMMKFNTLPLQPASFGK